jgi:hemoglobin-like flavoprotein
MCDSLLETLKKEKKELGLQNDSLSKEIDQVIVKINNKIKNIEIQSDDYRMVKQQLVEVVEEITDLYTETDIKIKNTQHSIKLSFN